MGGAQGESSTGAQRRWGVSWLSWAFQRGAPARAASNLKGALVALSEERNRFRLHSPIHLPRPVSTGWRARLFLPPTHPPVADEVLHQRTSISCGLGHVQLAVAADACPLRTCNAISGGGEERSKTRAPPIPFSHPASGLEVRVVSAPARSIAPACCFALLPAHDHHHYLQQPPSSSPQSDLRRRGPRRPLRCRGRDRRTLASPQLLLRHTTRPYG